MAAFDEEGNGPHFGGRGQRCPRAAHSGSRPAGRWSFASGLALSIRPDCDASGQDECHSASQARAMVPPARICRRIAAIRTFNLATAAAPALSPPPHKPFDRLIDAQGFILSPVGPVRWRAVPSAPKTSATAQPEQEAPRSRPSVAH
jgi:hypothetical protein